MIIYNVTINIEDDAHDAWLAWMLDTHIPEVMGTGLFEDFTFSKLLTRQHDETGTTYIIQYLCENIGKYEHYQAAYAPALQAKTQKYFGGKFVAFRTLMEKL